MAKNLLNAKAIEAAVRAAKAEGTRLKPLHDGEGLYLEVQPSGKGWWRLRYSVRGRENRMSLGVYPQVGLSIARQRRDERLTRLAEEGVDPVAAKKSEKAEQVAADRTKRALDNGEPLPGAFEYVAREWIREVHGAKVSAAHAERTRIRFEKDVFPWLGRRPIGEIEAPELLSVLRRITTRGAIETAHRAKDACGQVFRYGIAVGACRRNPAADLRDALPAVQTKHLAAIVDPQQAGKLLRDLDAYEGSPVTLAALKLSALLLLRPGELRHLRWDWVDLEACAITVPGSVMKRLKVDKANGPPHFVPLARQAISILRDLQPLTGQRPFVFPSATSPATRCMSENTVRSALRRMGYGNDDMTAHGFRAMARTMAAERLEIDPLVIEAQLAHAVPDALGRAYNRTTYADQRRELMVKWADYLDTLRTGAKVIPFERVPSVA